MYYLSVNSHIFAHLCHTRTGLYKYFSSASRHELVMPTDSAGGILQKEVLIFLVLVLFLLALLSVSSFLVSLISTPVGGSPASLTRILVVRSPENSTGTPAGGFLLSSPGLWHLSDLLYHPVAIATSPPVGSESQPGLEEKFKWSGGVF